MCAMRLTIHRLDDWGTNEVFVLREDLVPVAPPSRKCASLAMQQA